MLIKNIVDEDFVNYKKPSMFIGSCFCDWKCCLDGNFPITVCQNNGISKQKNIDFSNDKIYKRYIENKITKSVVIGGLEPIKQANEIIELIYLFRKNNCFDDFVIYTGYNKYEIELFLNEIKKFKNIVFKFGRYVPNQEKHYDSILGVYLASDNQFGERIS